MYLLLIFILILFLISIKWLKRKNSRLPPGPQGIPILGSLHKFSPWNGILPHITMLELSKQYGDVLSLTLGSRLVVLLSSHAAIYEAYVKKAKVFAGRPEMISFTTTDHNATGVALSNFSETYKSNRKKVTRAIHRLYSDTSTLDGLLQVEASKMLNLFDETLASDQSIQPMLCFENKVIPSTFLAMMFGKHFDYKDPEFHDIIKPYHKWFEISEADLPDFFPILGMIPNKRLDTLSECGLAFQNIVTQKLYESENKDDRSFSLHHYLTDDYGNISNLDHQDQLNFARVASDLILGGLDAPACTLAWALLYLLDQPDVLRKCREEIKLFYGNSQICFNKKDLLPYFSATLYDILRHSSVGPLSLPRMTLEDVEYRSYVIPKGTMIVANLWACNHDPNVWKETEILYPENFLNENGELDESAIRNLSTFSSGFRRCVGDVLAFQLMFILLGTFIQNYEFKLDEKPEDMTPIRNVTLKPKHYSLFLTKINKC